MTRRSVRGARAVLLTAVVVSAAAACTDDGGSPSGAVSEAASAVASVAASASAAAQEKLEGFKNGVNAGKDVKAGAVTEQGGRATTKITVTNSADSAKSYIVQINFRDPGGNLLDTAVVTVDDVQPGTPKDATVRSNRTLVGDVTAEVGRALRH
ncbi:hypothetical protein LRD69_07745 [Streptomyces sp. JH14]|uniref:hypothetical protein n=1 Tax=Streptomyces sp. JH14 TaxID=2793630 RepID=UPI0023F9D436|nr:hypothetical protein [Streptomyces sp. JH14]MDF6042059.1 hypothetical protein [Streptomyces sp. JH14]